MALGDPAIGLDASYAAQATQVAIIRRDVAAYASGCGADHDTLVRIGLAVSEAATNAVLHAYRLPGMGAGAIHVTAGDSGGALDVCVRDEGVGMSPRPDSPGLGLGLCLMAHESDHFEIGTSEDGGTAIFLRFALRAGVEPDGRLARS
jgi:serine/threonine-protein kinase RsbW/stage II sporulation protein AB (anti-sigma F factor)